MWGIIEFIIMLVVILISVAIMTLGERKIMGSLQRRIGPERVGYKGIMQPFADGMKLMLKEIIYPSLSNKYIFIIAPMISLLLSIITWVVIPWGKGVYIKEIKVGIIYILAISSLGIYGIILSGWSANSKYAFIGSIRSTAQMISYEISIGLIIINVIIINGTYNINNIIINQKGVKNIVVLLPMGLMMIISGLAETNRAPFDIPEAESELTAGFMTEHSGMGFAYFFIAEYANILLMSTIFTILFISDYDNYSIWLGIKVSMIVFIFIWVRASFPRFRYDQLMNLMWINILPILIGLVIIIPGIVLII